VDHLPMWTLSRFFCNDINRNRLGEEEYCQTMGLLPMVVTSQRCTCYLPEIPRLRLPFPGLLIFAHHDALHRPYTLCPSCKLLRGFDFPGTSILHSLNNRLSASLIDAVPCVDIQSQIYYGKTHTAWLEQGRFASCSCHLTSS
jgi:hypothetical protein